MRRTPRRRQNRNNPQQNFIAIICIVVFFSIWQSYFPPVPPVGPKAGEGVDLTRHSADSIAQAAKSPDELSVVSAGVSTSVALQPAKPLHTLLDQGRFEVVVNTHGELDEWSILEDQYRRKLSEEKSVPYLLATAQPRLKDQSLEAPFLTPSLKVFVNKKPLEGEYQLSAAASDDAMVVTLSTPVVQVKRSYKLVKGAFRLQSNVEVKNVSKSSVQVEIRGLTRALHNASESEGGMFSPPLNMLESVCAYADEFERDGASSLASKREDKDPMSFDGARWYGVDSRYFMSAISVKEVTRCAQGDSAAKLMINTPIPAGYNPVSTESSLFLDLVEAGASVSREVSMYGGPKKIELLNAGEPELSQAIDFGIFSPICLPMLWAMGFFFTFVSNWGVAIILLTLLVKLITLPLTIKQYKSMAAMKTLQPAIAAIKAEHKDDAMRVQQETMALYKKHGVNPLSGCLPMLVMMPIYFALYRTIYSAVELYQAPFFGWLTDLSMPDPYFVTPVLLALLMLLQSKMQPTNNSMDPAQRKLLTVFMPLFFGAMMLFLPSALVLYILVNTLLGLVQQRWSQRQAESQAEGQGARA